MSAFRTDHRNAAPRNARAPLHPRNARAPLHPRRAAQRPASSRL
jgi:hypothetical protein